MNKTIERVMIFYADGTFTEIKNVVQVKEFNDKPEWKVTATRPCTKCGVDLNTTSGSCIHSNCPSGRGFPPFNLHDVRD